jgi:hypothetical protein
MIEVLDDFLSEELYDKTHNKLKSNDFEVVDTGEKKFWVQFSDDDFNKSVLDKLKEVEGREVENVLSFFRLSTDVVDTDWRIHSDTIINDDRPAKSIIIYFSESEMEGIHGTAFWTHNELGPKLPRDISEERYNYMILNEANNLDLWTLDSVIGYKTNRALISNVDYFHSKYPNKSWESGRMIYIMFYK